ncbi:aminotransferase class III-fold pyridoxal phosphate-dependent enzyme [Fluviispira multicolorata]|uniref:ATP-dependent dethiobiotin synthetase BioD n=1 Tax=Fluviispira multicolorata TaxID=2654512 RepID=A0A833N5L8_9BACT|nr:aminotransferase class III-fold pyridoxal phosphate-dependent enzyme [Fluviispira multicolorata]KAB8028076.1 aminotransferase class III-fold pyridoxal phosphate-dependent enzyme [Fluviispira multicolorata]
MLTKYPAFYVMGANTDIGKTLFSGGLCQAATNEDVKTLYLKPIQTGFPKDSDSSFVKKYNPSENVSAKTIFSLSEAVSPHRALKGNSSLENFEEQLLNIIRDEIKQNESDFILIEGAGGAASPSLYGNLQCDFYRSLRLPVIFIADAKLGGISTSISTLELLEARGFIITSILLFAGEHENAPFLRKYFKDKYPVFEFKNLNVKNAANNSEGNTKELEQWYQDNLIQFSDAFRFLSNYHLSRIQIVDEYIEVAKKHIWWPFTQHKLIDSPKYIESAYKDDISFVNLQNEEHNNFLSQNHYDASASWWTQGIGHGLPKITQAAAVAAGRYGHVMFPGNVHEPVAKLTYKLINTVGKAWADRVFYSDNGSTAVEIALKIAFRKSIGLPQNNEKQEVFVLGLKDSYHGDTHGSMNATNPNIFKTNEHWYTPKGFWLEYPVIALKNKKYLVTLPLDISENSIWHMSFQSLGSFFDDERLDSELAKIYFEYIQKNFELIAHQKLRVGALLIEPIIQGAGGMKFIDPLFQKILVSECQKRKIPIIIDEVFTGFWRLGKMTAAQMLNIKPDVACYAKLLSGGLLPMSVTLAREEYFECFLGDSLDKALLHGHSYTATPIGCSVALESFDEIQASINYCVERDSICNLWNYSIIEKISCLSNIAGVYALGSIFALELKDTESGYASIRAKEFVTQLQNASIAVRPLGNVIYILAGFNSSKKKLDSILMIILEILSKEIEFE